MRDPNRIPRVLALLQIAWSICPDQRLCQLMNNIVVLPDRMSKLAKFDYDAHFFNFEDDRLEGRLRKFISENAPPGTIV